MRMHVLPGGRLRMRRRIYFPDAPKEEAIDLPVSAHLLRHPSGNVLFDSGCNPEVARDPEGRWGGLAKVMQPAMSEDETVIASLGRIGVAPDDIDLVVCSHLHPDHCGCTAFFRKATILCHADELAAARAPDAEKAGFLPGEWDVGLPIETFEGERDLFGDGRIVLLPLPGHTQGTVGCLVSLERSGSFLLASDAVALKAHLDRDFLPRNTWNPELASRSLAEVRRLEAAGATVVCGHDEGQWRELRKEVESYD